MKKSILLACVSVLLLAACSAAGTNESSSITTLPPEAFTTTADSAVHENSASPPQKKEKIQLITAAPFGEAQDNPALEEELIPALEKICLADKQWVLGYEVPRSEEILETLKDGQSYLAVLPSFAESKEDVLAYFQSVYTENYYNSLTPPLEELLFGEDRKPFYNQPPLYKVINGRLGVLDNIGTTNNYKTNSPQILETPDASTVILALVGTDIGSGSYVRYMTLKKSPEYGWRLDSERVEGYSPGAQIAYHLFVGNRDRFNTIFAGSKPVLKDGEKVILIHNDVQYEEIENVMSMQEMKDFLYSILDKKTALKYIYGSIINVYFEQDGYLYRRADALKLMIPEYSFEFLAENFQPCGMSYPYDAYTLYLTNEKVIQTDTVAAVTVHVEYENEEHFSFDEITDIKIISELPLIDAE